MSANYDLAELSHEFLAAVKRDAKTDNYRSTLAALNESDLADFEEDVATAFWVNLYNAFVQIDLEQDPSLYERKRQFFGETRIDIAGTELSLDDIEHGILRSSKWKYGLGYIPRLFPSDFERRHRLSRVDPRIHFALNCGAESCPPIVAYTATDIGSELETSTRSFLQQSSTYDTEDDELRVTRLFLYYRGDFGGRSGIYELLERYDVIEEGARPRIRYEPYDWTVHKGMYRE
ncbi:DUF547 domain-containing protein [Halorhabdus rudnickae]|uniref:DUF547 domain-containing protein n=1 Tax=Halorhabdus rudnickae TaxID=1775544 RepID=UPI0010833B39|nr:DUF547 domain-containing protein [Halorhabdus rudnickae]